ncbi:putative Mitochondrial substrate carrier family protein L [Glarea lozoyensis 74030]|uniref:Putative Mitochondrial substrate carrier family protein L n=1 Tax=Glarea lozoyensis (strain ATCC 74030 / MF5533) TaxID=1104152 RepID=H0ED54_GLAL7|nr:putative Mitochondrial substrate carrier family protein L [Glarea lozoyensis 74030]
MSTTTRNDHGVIGDVKSSAVMEKKVESGNYKGFVAGVFSGVAKLSVGHPFDTIKVRLQTSTSAQFSGPLQCLLQTVRNESITGLYKGATPPLVGWMFMDSIMLGSLTFYRKFLHENVFSTSHLSASPSSYARREKPVEMEGLKIDSRYRWLHFGMLHGVLGGGTYPTCLRILLK